MANSTISAANVVTKFQKNVRKEFVRGDEKFSPFIGDTEQSVIQVNRDLKKHSIPLIGALGGAGVRGSSQLVGSEEALSNYAMTFQPTYVRNGVLIDNEEQEKSEFDLFQEAKPSLSNWMKQVKRDQMIQALGAIEAGGTYYNYGGTEASGAKGSSAASAANMDTWVTNNTDRILYGSAESNLTSGDHTTSLATIDTTNDKGSSSVLSHLKRMAQNCDPIIRPVRIDGTEPFFVYFCGQYSFRDLKYDSTIMQAQREALARGKSNPLFSGGDLMWDNILIVEVPDLDKFIDNTSGTGLWDGVWGANATGDSLLTAGASSARVGVGFLCGAQALTFGRGRDAMFKRRKEDDYEHLAGVAISAKYDIKKNFYNNKQHGMVTHFHAAAADA